MKSFMSRKNLNLLIPEAFRKAWICRSSNGSMTKHSTCAPCGCLFRVTTRLNLAPELTLYQVQKMDTYDSQIVEVAEDLCRVLGLKPQVRQLRWVDRVTRSKVNSDDFRFALGLAAFPDRMRGKLEPKEWRPLIASTLIFRKIFARNPPGSILVTVLALFVLLVIGQEYW